MSKRARRPRRPRVKYSEELKARIRRRAKTMTVDGIAETLGLTVTGVRYVLDREAKRPDQRSARGR